MYQQHHLQWPCVTKMNNLQVSSIHDQNEQQQQQQPKSVAIIIELKKQQQLKWKRKKCIWNIQQNWKAQSNETSKLKCINKKQFLPRVMKQGSNNESLND